MAFTAVSKSSEVPWRQVGLFVLEKLSVSPVRVDVLDEVIGLTLVVEVGVVHLQVEADDVVQEVPETHEEHDGGEGRRRVEGRSHEQANK